MAEEAPEHLVEAHVRAKTGERTGDRVRSLNQLQDLGVMGDHEHRQVWHADRGSPRSQRCQRSRRPTPAGLNQDPQRIDRDAYGRDGAGIMKR